MSLRHTCAVFLYIFAIKGIVCQENDCSLPDGSKGICVEIPKCRVIDDALQTAPRPLPADLANILKNRHCGFEKDMPKVCCQDDILATAPTVNSKEPTLQTLPTIAPVTDGTTPSQIDDRGIGELEDVSNHKNLNLLPLTKCGDILESKLSKGNKTELFEYPWMALLQYDTGNSLKFLCGGSLISDRYVLTAAHCVTKLPSPNKLVAVRLGEYDTSTEIDCQIVFNERTCAPPVQDIPVEEVYSHPFYGIPAFANDVGLIRLARPADTTPESVRPVCLPTTFEVQNANLNRVTITGWGTTENQQSSPDLLQIAVPVVSNEACQKKFKRLRITPNQICAGGEVGVDSCKGDSGGPLVYPISINGVRMVQFGIVSAGVNVCSTTTTYPGIYVRVAYYMRWILNQMRQ